MLVLSWYVTKSTIYEPAPATYDVCAAGVQERCGKVFRELAAASCLLDVDTRRDAAHSKHKSLAAARVKLEKLHAAHALSLDLVLNMGLEMGSHSADCWPHVFR